MSQLTRRSFLLASSGAAVGNVVASGPALATDPGRIDFSASGLVTGRPKPLRRKSVPGFLSAEQIAPHHAAHYGGALKGYIAADERIEHSNRSGKLPDAPTFGALKRAIASKANSVVLHELYFDGIGPKGADPGGGLQAAITARFGSIEGWAADFAASANASAGWAMLVRHPANGKLYNLVSDDHAAGPLWMATPLIVVDTYEHAFYIDYQNRKADYVERFLDHIDWKEADQRFRSTG